MQEGFSAESILILLKNPIANSLFYVPEAEPAVVFKPWLAFTVICVESPGLRRAHCSHLHLEGEPFQQSFHVTGSTDQVVRQRDALKPAILGPS